MANGGSGYSSWFFLIALGIAGYYAWDGYVARDLDRQEIGKLSDSRAGVVESGWVSFTHQPLPNGATHALVLDLSNKSDYIIRQITLSGEVDSTSGDPVGFSGHCLAGGSDDLRVPIGSVTQQTCIVPLPPDAAVAFTSANFKQFTWFIVGVQGHHAPIRVVKSIVDWAIGLANSVTSLFEPVNE